MRKTLEQLVEEQTEHDADFYFLFPNEALKLLQQVRKSTIEETLYIASFNIEHGYMGANIDSINVRKELDVNSIEIE